jgi:hypothetical protein
MKKIKNFHFLVLIAVLFIAFSCKKNEVIISSLFSLSENDDEIIQNEVTWLPSNDNRGWFGWLILKFTIWHTAADCGNKCVKIFGEQGHIDCRGFGNVCNHTAIAYLIQNGDVLKLVFENPDALGEDLDFLLPDRTLRVTNPINSTNLWLNIPEQLLLRDNNGIPFEILDIWFSEEPELENK